MEQNFPIRNVNIGSIALRTDDIQNIFKELTLLVKEQADIEISRLTKRDDQTEEDFSQVKLNLRENVFKVEIVVYRSDGSFDIGDTKDVATLKPSAPPITRVYMSNINPFRRGVNFEPDHSFELLLDFSVPPLFDANAGVSSPTRNDSFFRISGSRSGWLAGAEKAYQHNVHQVSFLRQRLHEPFTYDWGQVVLALPAVFYTCFILGTYIEKLFEGMNSFVTSAAYLYVGLVTMWIYRALFSYTKWAFPRLEITDQKTSSTHHRRVWWGLIVALAAAFFWNTLEPYWSVQGIMDRDDKQPVSTSPVIK